MNTYRSKRVGEASMNTHRSKRVGEDMHIYMKKGGHRLFQSY